MANDPTRLLVVHEEATDLLSLARTLSEANFDVANARTLNAAVAKLEAGEGGFEAMLVHWSLPRSGALHLARLAHGLGYNAPRFLLAFCGSWQRVDLRKCLQIGYDGFLTNPISPKTLSAELQLLHAAGTGMTRTVLLEEAGVAGLTYDQRLWSGELSRREDQILAHHAEERLAEISKTRALRTDVLSADMERIAGGSVGLSALQALSEALSRGGEDLGQVARSWGVQGDLLGQMYAVMQDPHEAAALRRVRGPELTWMADAMVQQAQQRRRQLEPVVSDALMRRLASAVLSEAATDETYVEFAHALGRRHQIPLEIAETIDADDLYYVAGCVVGLQGEHPLDEARVHLCLLGHLMMHIAPWGPDPTLLPGLADLLRTDLEAIKEAACEIDPSRPKGPEELAPLSPIADSLLDMAAAGQELEGGGMTELIRWCRTLGDAERPGGALDRRRMQVLTEALRQGPVEILPRGTVGALGQWLTTLQSFEPSAPPEVLLSLLDEGPWTHERISTLVDVLEGFQVPQGDPPVPVEQIKAALGPPPVWVEPTPAPPAPKVGSLAHWLEENARSPEQILARLEAMAREGDRAGVRALRGALDLGPTPARVDDVLRLLDESALPGAFVALADLPEDHPRLGPVCNTVALALGVSGCYAAASAVYRRALSQHPDRAYLWFNFGRMMVEQGRAGEARSLLEEACRLAPDLHAAQRLLHTIRAR